MSEFEQKLTDELLAYRIRLVEEHQQRINAINAALREIFVPDETKIDRPRMEMRVSVGNRVIEERLAA
jgi:hypothetical protein